MDAGRGLRRQKQAAAEGPHPRWALPAALADPGPSREEALKCPALALGPACHLGCTCLRRATPGTTVLPPVGDHSFWPAFLAALLLMSPDLMSPPPATLCPAPHLDLPLVFSFLQTRQATRLLNATTVPRANPPATTRPSSGTSTRVARSPGGHLLVRF